MKAVTMMVPTSKRHCWCLRWSAVAVSLFVQETLNVLQRAFSCVVSAQVTGAERIIHRFL